MLDEDDRAAAALHPATGPGDRLAALHPHRRHLHQASLRQRLDQDVRQARLHPAHRDHDQRRELLQAPPEGGTSTGTFDTRPRPSQEDHLQPDRPATDPPRLQSPLPRAPLRHRRLLRRRARPRSPHQAAHRRRQDRQGHQLLRSDRQRPSARPAKPAHQYRRHSTRRSPLAPRPLVPAQNIPTAPQAARHRRHQTSQPAPIATTSPAPAEPLPQPSVASLKTSSSLLSHDTDSVQNSTRVW